MDKRITMLGAPVWLGQPHYGAQLGPDAIRAAGLWQTLRLLCGEVIDAGNLVVPQSVPAGRGRHWGMNCLGPVRYAAELLAARVSRIVTDGRFPLILGGDHSVALGTLAGVAKHYRSLGVIWLDAHTDINTPVTSPSGNIHGMPLAASLGFGHQSLTNIGGYHGKVHPANVVFIGVRDIDPGEAALIAEQGIALFTADDVARLGIDRVIAAAIAYLRPKCDGIHLSFDLDVLDPEVVCGVGTPVAHGLDLASAMAAVNLLFRSDLISSAEFVEVNPLLDRGGQTVAVSLALIRTLFGGQVEAGLAV